MIECRRWNGTHEFWGFSWIVSIHVCFTCYIEAIHRRHRLHTSARGSKNTIRPKKFNERFFTERHECGAFGIFGVINFSCIPWCYITVSCLPWCFVPSVVLCCSVVWALGGSRTWKLFVFISRVHIWLSCVSEPAWRRLVIKFNGVWPNSCRTQTNSKVNELKIWWNVGHWPIYECYDLPLKLLLNSKAVLRRLNTCIQQASNAI